MNSAAFGFTALASRYHFLFNDDPPIIASPDRRFDLDDVIKESFGEGYANHPKLRSLCTLNGLHVPHFMLGKDEAECVSRQNYGPVVLSTKEKTHAIAQLFQRLVRGNLKTLNSVGVIKFAGEPLDAVSTVLTVAERMRSVWLEFQRRHGGRATLSMNDEYDAQDLFRGLLRIFFGDIRSEDPSPQHAGASTRIDFTLPDVELAVELKFTRPNMSAKTLGEELTVDKGRYSAHGRVSHLIFLVFDDRNAISNPRGIESDLTKEKSRDDFAVTVRILERR